MKKERKKKQKTLIFSSPNANRAKSRHHKWRTDVVAVVTGIHHFGDGETDPKKNIYIYIREDTAKMAKFTRRRTKFDDDDATRSYRRYVRRGVTARKREKKSGGDDDATRKNPEKL